MDEDYEILPHKEIEDLKKQLEAYRKGPPSSAQASMEKLTDTVNTLINIFREASTQMSIEDKEQDILVTKLEPMDEKVDRALDQNKKIAEGIIAVADMIKDLQDSLDDISKKVETLQQQQPMMQRPQTMQAMGQPMGMMTEVTTQQQSFEEMPPLPPFTPPIRPQPMGMPPRR